MKGGRKWAWKGAAAPWLNPKPVAPPTRYPVGRPRLGGGQETGFCASLSVALVNHLSLGSGVLFAFPCTGQRSVWVLEFLNFHIPGGVQEHMCAHMFVYMNVLCAHVCVVCMCACPQHHLA